MVLLPEHVQIQTGGQIQSNSTQGKYLAVRNLQGKAAKKKGRGKPIDRLDIACSNRIALPKSVLKTCSQAWQEPSQDFQNSRPKLSQMWPEPYKSIQIRGTFWIVGTFSKRFKSLRNCIETTPQWHSKAAKKTLTSSPKMGKLGQSPHVSNEENTSIYPKHQRASFAFEP